jgi:hypothetical protein
MHTGQLSRQQPGQWSSLEEDLAGGEAYSCKSALGMVWQVVGVNQGSQGSEPISLKHDANLVMQSLKLNVVLQYH